MTDLPDLPRAYVTDWALFTDWCAATGRTNLPADPATIQAFLEAAPGTADTRRRRVSAINAVHRRRGHHRDRTDQQRIDVALQHISVGGWPTGAFGRRDALLLTLRFRAGLTLRQIVELTSDRIALDGRVLTVETNRTTRLEPHDDPALCPSCIWLRWSAVLRRTHLTNAALAEHLQRQEHHPTLHLCKDEPAPLTRRLPVFVPIDRWGSLPLPLRASTSRSAIALSNQHLTGRPPIHPAAPVPAEAAPLPTVQPVDHQAIHAAGLAARRQAVTELHHARARLDEIDSSADDLDARIQELAAIFGL